ncbi:hypothetical protein [Vibrio sp. HN007]|uniref:hypothetical protein n=1 Tax=Vibrio iocasae TaxID=3098914 RepID=UPI0035D40D18
MNKSVDKTFNLGGSVEKALSGDYELKVIPVLQEAWKFTLRNFLSFSPAILFLLLVQAAIFYTALQMQIGDPWQIIEMIQNPETLDPNVFQAVFVANFSYEVVSAPIFAGVSLMAMSHAAGLKTYSRHIFKGLQFTIPVIVATLAGLLLQGIAGMLLPLLSMYFSIAFSNAVLLICEKRVSPMRSLFLSLRAVNKKLFPVATLYLVMMLAFVTAAVFYGFLLILVLPMFFHVKGIIYRNMFGITLKIVTTNEVNDDDDSDDEDDAGPSDSEDKENNDSKDSQIFNA